MLLVEAAEGQSQYCVFTLYIFVICSYTLRDLSSTSQHCCGGSLNLWFWMYCGHYSRVHHLQSSQYFPCRYKSLYTARCDVCLRSASLSTYIYICLHLELIFTRQRVLVQNDDARFGPDTPRFLCWMERPEAISNEVKASV